MNNFDHPGLTLEPKIAAQRRLNAMRDFSDLDDGPHPDELRAEREREKGDIKHDIEKDEMV